MVPAYRLKRQSDNTLFQLTWFLVPMIRKKGWAQNARQIEIRILAEDNEKVLRLNNVGQRARCWVWLIPVFHSCKFFRRKNHVR